MKSPAEIDALIASMTIDEKVGQLGCFADALRPFAPDVNPEANARDAAQVLEQIRAGKVGALFNGAGAAAGRESQRVAVEESRLGIPLLFGADVIHGMRTVFPIPLGEAASFEPELAERTARAAAVEATAAGIHWTYAPAVDIARDQRWGRVAEGAGEDVYLGSRFAEARVRGFQGADLTAADSLLATPKHFVAYGAVQAGMDYNSVDISPQTLHEVHLPPFKAAFDAGAITTMSAFNDINGVPASANREIMTDLLRGEWAFPGLVVSDYTADMELIAHGFAVDARHATKLAFTAGVDMSMQSGFYADHLPDLVATGQVPEAMLDDSVRRVLNIKNTVGLFDDPYRSLDAERETADVTRDEHAALARDVARRSIVMLKNDGDVLPLKKSGQRIALIGPFASDRQNLEGCWTLFGDAARHVTLEDGLRQAMDDAGMLSVEPGCDFETELPGGFAAAIAAAEAADVVLLAIGEPQVYSGEAQSRTQIVVPAVQQALAEAIASTGKPVVVLLRNGRALALHGAVRDAQAILVTWFLGSQTGPGVADVVFGDYSPSARLPVSFPQDSGQQPYYYNHRRTGRPEIAGQPYAFKSRWREFTNEALYPFGHGLGYARFAYAKPTIGSTRVGWNEVLTIRCKVTNHGELDAEETVQLYIHDKVASRVRPVRELKGFAKVTIPAGSVREVEFALTRHDLAFAGADTRPVAEPGVFQLWVSPSSTTGEPVEFELLAP